MQITAPSLANVLILGFAGVFAALLAAGGGGTAQWLFPAAAAALGIFLYVRYPAQYIAFVWWLWFLTPLVRRIADYQSGWHQMSPVMLAPLLVSMFAAITFVQFLPLLRIQAYFPFLLVLLGLVYGYLIGVIRLDPAAATYGFLTWATPVLFGFHVAATWWRYLEYVRVLTSTFISGVVVMGVYGLIQYFHLPAWDVYWMLNAEINSVGLSRDLLVRVFGTMNSPTPSAVAIMAGLILLFTTTTKVSWLAGLPGYTTLLLTLVRSAWLDWSIALSILMIRMNFLKTLKIVLTILILLLCIIPIAFFTPVGDTITRRLSTFQNIENDTSFRARLALYDTFMSSSFSNVIGNGLGSVGLSTRLANEGKLGALGTFDSGIMDIALELGWIGSIIYISGVLWLVINNIFSTTSTSDLFVHACRGIFTALLVHLIFLNTLSGSLGMVFWTFIGTALSAASFWRKQKSFQETHTHHVADSRQ
jgi:hypothetical protein